MQLRMKDTPAEGIIARGREILALCRRYDALLIVNDDPRLAKAIGADGVHLGQNDTPPDEARIILGRQAIIGCTANTFAHIARIAQSSADYIGLGPFRYTTTKKNLSPILGEEGYPAHPAADGPRGYPAPGGGHRRHHRRGRAAGDGLRRERHRAERRDLPGRGDRRGNGTLHGAGRRPPHHRDALNRNSRNPQAPAARQKRK